VIVYSADAEPDRAFLLDLLGTDQTRTLMGAALSCSGDLPTPLEKLSSQLGAGCYR
jgi:hypothetical protein